MLGWHGFFLTFLMRLAIRMSGSFFSFRVLSGRHPVYESNPDCQCKRHESQNRYRSECHSAQGRKNYSQFALHVFLLNGFNSTRQKPTKEFAEPRRSSLDPATAWVIHCRASSCETGSAHFPTKKLGRGVPQRAKVLVWPSEKLVLLIDSELICSLIRRSKHHE
jgi:hypothetical protein